MSPRFGESGPEPLAGPIAGLITCQVHEPEHRTDTRLTTRRSPTFTRHPHPRHGSLHPARCTPRVTAHRGRRPLRSQDIHATSRPAPRRRRRPRPHHQATPAQVARTDRHARPRTTRPPAWRRPGGLALPRASSSTTARPAIPHPPPARPRHQHLGTTEHRPVPTCRSCPRQVLADVLGFRLITFENYARLAGSTRGDYPALREVAD